MFPDLMKYEIKYAEVTQHFHLVGLYISKHPPEDKCHEKMGHRNKGR